MYRTMNKAVSKVGTIFVGVVYCLKHYNFNCKIQVIPTNTILWHILNNNSFYDCLLHYIVYQNKKKHDNGLVGLH